MQGRKDYTKDELDHAKTAVDQQLAAHRKLRKAISAAAPDGTAATALEAFEPLFFNNMTLVLDRYFVHRLRVVAGKDGNPLNEVELLAESLTSNGGILRGSNVIKFVPGQSVTKLSPGDRIALTSAQFERLAEAFFTEIESKFVSTPTGR